MGELGELASEEVDEIPSDESVSSVSEAAATRWALQPVGLAPPPPPSGAGGPGWGRR